MLIPFGIVVCMGIVFAVLSSRQARQSRTHRTDRPPTPSRSGAEGTSAYRPSPFDHAGRWVAVKSSNAAAVQSALALNNPTPCCWTDILAQLDEPKLFLSPPVAGWTLVMGQALPEPGADVDDCFHFVRHLSRQLGQVQFFAVNRVLGHHAWVQAIDGRILRAYAWAGETLWDQGARTRAETELGLRCWGYGETPQRAGFGSTAPEQVNAEKIFTLAARWSIDPTAIDDLALEGTHGIAGDRSQPRSH